MFKSTVVQSKPDCFLLLFLLKRFDLALVNDASYIAFAALLYATISANISGTIAINVVAHVCASR